jgi:hypothetical protein
MTEQTVFVGRGYGSISKTSTNSTAHMLAVDERQIVNEMAVFEQQFKGNFV